MAALFGRHSNTPYESQGLDTTLPDFRLGMVVGAGVGFGGGLLSAGDDLVVGSGNAYSVAFETRLSASSFPGVSRAGHFQEANANLLGAMNADAGFAATMDGLIPGIRGLLVGARGGISRHSPGRWTWHHAPEPGVMQLVPRVQHQAPGNIQNILHPAGRGGYSIWGK